MCLKWYDPAEFFGRDPEPLWQQEEHTVQKCKFNRSTENKKNKHALALAIAASCSVTAFSAVAQSQTAPAALPEIIVSSQKREENLSDVPLSVNIVSGAKLDSNNINRIADITEFVPNLTTTETGISTQLYIRGIGSGNNQGFEQSAGQYLDGIYYGRQQLIRTPFLDLERVEVLRGPQGILFGKNSIAGALNMQSARPTEATEVSLKALYEVESAQQEYTGILSGALSDNVRARLAVRLYEEDGYIQNTLTGNDEPRRDEDSVRLTVDWDITTDLTASLKLERHSFDTRGRQIEIVQDDPNLIPPSLSPMGGLNYSQILAAFGQPLMDSQLDYQRQVNTPEFSNNELDNMTLTLNYQLGDNVLTSVTGLVGYDFSEVCDCDYTPGNLFSVRLQEDYEQFSQEIRLASPSDQAFQWVVGAYYQTSEMDSLEAFDVPANSVFGTVAATSPDPEVQALSNILGTSALRWNAHESDMWAVFAQGIWELAPDLRLIAGGRFTSEDKNAFREMTAVDTATSTPTQNPMAPYVYLGAFSIFTTQTLGANPLNPSQILPGHTLNGSRSESQFTPQLTLQWDYSDQAMAYVSATRGFKGGGFDARANNPFSFEFDEEKATSWEAGVKSRLFDGLVELNAAAFFTDYDQLQISQFDGTVGFNVGNAANTQIRGLELDGRWAATDSLIVSYAYAWLDFEFQDFPNGNCYNRQPAQSLSPAGAPLCSFTGMSGQYTPEHNLSLAFDYVRPVNSSMDFVAGFTMNYTGEQNIHDNLDPSYNIDSVTRLNLKLALETDQWSLAFIGRNLSDEKVMTYAGNAPVSASTFGTNTFYAFIDRPRQLAVELGYRFK